MSRTGASTPDATKAAAAASSRVCSLRRASARLRGTATRPARCRPPAPSSRMPLATGTMFRMLKRNTVPLGQYARPRTSRRRGVRHDASIPAQLRDHDRPAAGRLPDVLRVWREADAIPRDRARLAVRPPDADRRRPGRPDLRGLDAAVGARRADRAAAARPAGDQQPLPAARDAGQDRHDRRHRLRRAARLRHRRGLAAEHPDGPPRVRRPRPALPRLRALRGEPRRGAAPSSGGCGPRTSRSTSTAPTSSSPARSATPSPSSARTRRS